MAPSDPPQDLTDDTAAHLLLDAGWSLKYAGDDVGATEMFFRAVQMAPDLPRAHLSYAEALLSRGELLSGWREFTWRKQFNAQTRKIVERMPAPEWTGEAMKDLRLLVVCDEGVGDAIMFARYLPRVAERVGHVAVGWEPYHPELFGRMKGVSAVYTSPPKDADFDAYVMICDLPNVFATTLETIPTAIPYMPLDQMRVRRWRARLEAELPAKQPRVGINWAGSPSHVRDAQRSLAFSQLQPLLDVDGISFVSLQKDVRDADRADLAAATNILDVSATLQTFSDTAALIANLDLVVSVDSAVAHLAGALGARVLILLPKPADWRWLIDRSDTPWYPTMRLIRQQFTGDWAPVLREAAVEVQRLLR